MCAESPRKVVASDIFSTHSGCTPPVVSAHTPSRDSMGRYSLWVRIWCSLQTKHSILYIIWCAVKKNNIYLYQKCCRCKIRQKCVCGRGSAPHPAGSSRRSPDPLVGWEGDTPPHHTPLVFGASILAPSALASWRLDPRLLPTAPEVYSWTDFKDLGESSGRQPTNLPAFLTCHNDLGHSLENSEFSAHLRILN